MRNFRFSFLTHFLRLTSYLSSFTHFLRLTFYYLLLIHFLLVFWAPNIYSANITLGPYIDNLSNSQTSIVYETDVPSPAWLGWGDWPKCDRYITPLPVKKRQRINIYGIKPGKKYCYNLYLPVTNSTYSYIASSSTFFSFYDESISSFSFILFSNTSYNSEDENIKFSSAVISHFDENMLLLLNVGNMLKYSTDYVKIFYGIEGVVKTKPVFNSMGPSEYGDNKEKYEGYKFIQSNYSPYRAFTRNGVVPHYYYVDVSNSRFIFLDNNNLNEIKDAPSFKKGTKQWLWLEDVLKYSKDKKWIFVILNHPVYPSQSWNEEDRGSLEELLLKYRVDFVFENGSENFLRTKKIKYGTYDENGIYYIMLGGVNVYQTYPEDEEIIDSKLNIKGFLYTKINDYNIDMTYYDYSLNQLDRFVYSK